MGAGALTNLLFGRLFDRIGFPIVIFAFFIGAIFAPLVFLGQFWLALVGMGLWGIGMGAQNSLLKAVLTGVLAVAKRSTGFGLFYTGYSRGLLAARQWDSYMTNPSALLLSFPWSLTCRVTSLLLGKNRIEKRGLVAGDRRSRE
jgi:MFS family permease